MLSGQNDTLYQHLADALLDDQLVAVSRVVSKQAMMLQPHNFEIESEILAETLSGTDKTFLQIPGLSLTLSDLPPYEQMTVEELSREIAHETSEISRIDSVVKVLKEREEHTQSKKKLVAKMKDIETSIQEYTEWSELKAGEPERIKCIGRLTNE